MCRASAASLTPPDSGCPINLLGCSAMWAFARQSGTSLPFACSSAFSSADGNAPSAAGSKRLTSALALKALSSFRLACAVAVMLPWPAVMRAWCRVSSRSCSVAWASSRSLPSPRAARKVCCPPLVSALMSPAIAVLMAAPCRPRRSRRSVCRRTPAVSMLPSFGRRRRLPLPVNLPAAPRSISRPLRLALSSVPPNWAAALRSGSFCWSSGPLVPRLVAASLPDSLSPLMAASSARSIAAAGQAGSKRAGSTSRACKRMLRSGMASNGASTRVPSPLA